MHHIVSPIFYSVLPPTKIFLCSPHAILAIKLPPLHCCCDWRLLLMDIPWSKCILSQLRTKWYTFRELHVHFNFKYFFLAKIPPAQSTSPFLSRCHRLPSKWPTLPALEITFALSMRNRSSRNFNIISNQLSFAANHRHLYLLYA